MDRETQEAWATVKVRSVADRVSGHGHGSEKEEGKELAQEAMEKDEKCLKTLVKNLAEKGAVSGSMPYLGSCSIAHCQLVSVCLVDLSACI